MLLQRQESKPQGKSWGVPAGKKDTTDKTLEAAMQRELKEETGIKVDEKKLKYFGQFFVRYDDYDFIYHIFHLVLPEKPIVQIRETEHLGFMWVTPKEALEIDLIQDLDECIELFYDVRK